MAGLAEFCSYAGNNMGGNTELGAMAVFQHFPKTYINRTPLRLKVLCLICLAEAFAPGLPGESCLKVLPLKGRTEQKYPLTTKTQALAGNRKIRV